MVRPPAQTDGLRLGESHRHLEARGFEGQFTVAKEGRVLCVACGTESPAKRFTVDSQKRVEGVSDPDDESLVVALHCPACGARGALTLAYGPRAGRDEAAVLADLPPPRKR
jgi:hypothetical protein